MQDGPQIILERNAVLLSKYYHGDLSEDEKNELEEQCRQNPIIRTMLQRLDHKELVKEDLDYQEYADPDMQRSAFLEKLRARKALSGTTSKSKIIKWCAAAAAAVVLTLIARNALITHPAPVQKTVEKKDLAVNIQPHKDPSGINRAILTLFDGQKIILDSVAEGKEWNKYAITIKKTDTGFVRYDNPATLYLTGSGGINAVRHNTLETPRRGQFGITLPDGTRVWLNNESSLSFPAVFTGSKREVELTGEAFFDVAADARRPFFVRVPKKQLNIHVLGTSFNVSAYTEDPLVRTTLVTGKVRVIQKDNSTLLKPNEQLIAGENGVWQRRENVAEIPWRENRFDFDSASLQQVMRQIARQYDIYFEISGQVREHVYNGLFFRSLSLQEVLTGLSEDGKNFHFKLEKNKIIISP